MDGPAQRQRLALVCGRPVAARGHGRLRREQRPLARGPQQKHPIHRPQLLSAVRLRQQPGSDRQHAVALRHRHRPEHQLRVDGPLLQQPDRPHARPRPGGGAGPGHHAAARARPVCARPGAVAVLHPRRTRAGRRRHRPQCPCGPAGRGRRSAGARRRADPRHAAVCDGRRHHRARLRLPQHRRAHRQRPAVRGPLPGRGQRRVATPHRLQRSDDRLGKHAVCGCRCRGRQGG